MVEALRIELGLQSEDLGDASFLPQSVWHTVWHLLCRKTCYSDQSYRALFVASVKIWLMKEFILSDRKPQGNHCLSWLEVH